MLSKGYFSIGSSGSGESSSNVSEENGNIIFDPTDPIYIDEQNKVYYSNTERNSVLYLEMDKIFATKVV